MFVKIFFIELNEDNIEYEGLRLQIQRGSMKKVKIVISNNN